MDILIRDLDVMTIQKIDEQAKEKSMSRNEFLKDHLEKFAFLDVFVDERKHFEEVIQTNNKTLIGCLEKQKNLIEQLQHLEGIVSLLLMDTDDTDGSVADALLNDSK